LKWTDHGKTLLQENDFVSAEKCASFALFFQTTPTARARACLCKAFAQYEMGKTFAARREINEIKRLDSDVAKVRRSEMPFVKFMRSILNTGKYHTVLLELTQKCSVHFFSF